MGDHVLVIGATMLDTKGKPSEGLEQGVTNPASIQSTRGGTARNVAENLAHLGADVVLLSAVGADATGQRLLTQTAESGVDIAHVLTVPDANTGAYIALLNEDGSLAVALDDVNVMRAITPGYLNNLRRLFRDADMIMFDGSLSSATMRTIVRLATRYKVPICADPSSARLAHRLVPHLGRMHLIVPNEKEEAQLVGVEYTGPDPERSLALAQRLVKMGVDNVVITLSNFGLDYATSDETGYIPPRYQEIVDTTGTGDAVTAAIMFGMLNELPAIESIRLGAAAASLTLQTTDTVVPDLSLDMLYDHLII